MPKIHITYSALHTIQRKAGDPFMPYGYVYQYILPARVQPANSIMHKSIQDSIKSGKGPLSVLYLGK